MIDNVKAGEPIRASTINSLINIANAVDLKSGHMEEGKDDLDSVFTHCWTVNEFQTTLGDGLSIENPVVVFDNEYYICEQHGNVQTLSGTWYAGVRKDLIDPEESGLTGPQAIYTNDQSTSSQYKLLEVFKLHELSSSCTYVEYKNVNPTFSSLSGGGETQGAFRWSAEFNERTERYYGTFRYCNFQFGRKTYQATQGTWTIAIPEGGCTFYLYIYHSSPEAAVIVTQNIANTLDVTCIPLITVTTEGVITNDYRGMPVVPVWGSPAG